MRQHSILDDHDRRRRFRVPQKQGVMSHAKADDDVEIRSLRRQCLGLHDRVAHGFMSAAPVQLLLVGDADLGLIDRTDLAADRVIIDFVRL